jgi:hypothetical protein
MSDGPRVMEGERALYDELRRGRRHRPAAMAGMLPARSRMLLSLLPVVLTEVGCVDKTRWGA